MFSRTEYSRGREVDRMTTSSRFAKAEPPRALLPQHLGSSHG